MKKILFAMLAFAVIVSCGRKVSPEEREDVAIQRLIDIRTLQEAYKNVNSRYATTMDALQLFYNEGKMTVVLQVGSAEDLLMAAHTEEVAIKLISEGIRPEAVPEELHKLYNSGDKNLCFTLEHEIPVKDTLFRSRPDFCIDSLAFIPYSDGEMIEMTAVVRDVHGVKVPLFEAKIPYESLYKGLKQKFIDDRVSSCMEAGLYPGLKVGDLESPNNNAGSWE